MIIGILILIVIGRSYYKLAFDYERKNAWLYPILGIASYYGGMVLSGFVMLFIYTSFGDTTDALALLVIPFGVGSCWGLYAILKHNWKKEKQEPINPEVLDDKL
ncbi:MAG: hypothetical protein K0R65_1479 [Crocinitomicaceae bacterium]|jgi:hypothetical protein|nr:hypothetical protein [Crocinitomicaceae bacterium]